MNHTGTHFHTGYYNLAKNTSHQEMFNYLSGIEFNYNEYDEYDRDPCPYTCVYDFLQGSCQLFSLALHREFGYDAFEIWCGKCFHCFCTTTCNEKTVYIDVRGATTCLDDFIAGTARIKNHYDKIIPQDLKRDAQLSGEWDDVGYAIAMELIQKHPEYYDVRHK